MQQAQRIRVLIIDDSPVAREMIRDVLESAGDLEVVGEAANGEIGVEMVRQLHPQLVTMDVQMPEMNGLIALEQIMQEIPTPTLLVSGYTRRDAKITIEGLQKGAVDFVLKSELSRHLVAKVRVAARVKVIRLLKKALYSASTGLPPLSAVTPSKNIPGTSATAIAKTAPLSPGGKGSPCTFCTVIGSSTGGPQALRQLLEALPHTFASGIIIVQHMPVLFTQILATQLAQTSGLPVRVATDGEPLAKGDIVIVPGDHHLILSANRQIQLQATRESDLYRPSIDRTLISVAEHFNTNAVGILLTGMGDDGVIGLQEIKTRGGATYVQLPESCVVDSMPSRALKRGCVDSKHSLVGLAACVR